MRQPFHILHVEDDDLDAMNFQRATRNSDAIESLTVVHDGIEALARLRGGQVPRHRLVILLDIRMPRMSGLELLAELRADPSLRAIPVVILTTSLDDEDVGTAYQHNVAGYLLKSNDREQYNDSIAAFQEYWSRVTIP